MGAYQSNPVESLEPPELFKSKYDVEKQLLDRLYLSNTQNEDFRPEFQRVFEQRSCVEPLTAASHWKEQALLEFLIEENNTLQQSIKEAGPLLFKLAVYLGSYPFPPSAPNHTTYLTLNKFLVFAALCSPKIRDFTYIVPRDKNDRMGPLKYSKTKSFNMTRILFQGLTNDEDSTKKSSMREDGDDEDLMDVLVSCQSRKPNTKFRWSRQSLGKVANLLPTSRSKDLHGIVTEDELEILIRLLVCILLSDFGIRPPPNSSWGAFTKNVVRSILATFKKASTCVSGVDWTCFSTVIEESMPFLLHAFTRLIENSFHVRSPEDSTIEVSSSLALAPSKIISPQQICLMQICSAHGTYLYNTLLLSGPEDYNSVDTYVQALSTPERKLLLKVEDNSHNELIIGLGLSTHYIETSDGFEQSNPEERLFDTSLFVLSELEINRLHGTAKAGRAEGQEEGFEVKFEEARVVLGVGFKEGVLELGGRVDRFEVVGLEIWG